MLPRNSRLGQRMQFDQVKRRDFITLLGGAAAWPLAVRAQQTVVPVVGVLGLGSPDGFAARQAGIREGLNETGYIDAEGAR